jgi:hypothetical protein
MRRMTAARQKVLIGGETASTPFVGIGHPSKKIPNCPKSFLSLPWLPSNNQTV